MTDPDDIEAAPPTAGDVGETTAPAPAGEGGDPAAAPDAPAGDAERPTRRYQAAVSAGAMALAWANKEQAPDGATVVVTHEVSPLGRLGHPWTVPATSTLAFAVVLRPNLTAEQADIPWLIAALAVAEGIEEAGGPELAAAWPDLVVDAEERTRAAIRTDVQLGPGRVRNAVVTIRLDVTDEDEERREALLAAIGARLDAWSAELHDGVAGPVAAYEQRCTTIGRNLKLKLLPRGELRAHAAAIDSLGRLECRSPTGMVERLSVNQVRDVTLL